ncbi:MAG: DUF1211 domain-containing protein [Pseudomonadota bacterium]
MPYLTPEAVEKCPIEGEFRLRGLDTTRIEVFVDAAFAFAVTMLAISFDAIPSNFEEMITALKKSPAFIVAVAQLVWIWWAHNVWSRRFGLDDAMTAALSAALVIVVMIYVYPLRVLAEGAFHWLTGGFLPGSFQLQSLDELRDMFVILGIGFALLCALFCLFNAYALKRGEALHLDALERFHLGTSIRVWLGSAGCAALSITLALLLPDRFVAFAGFGYAPLGVVLPLIELARDRRAPRKERTLVEGSL